jgi:glutamine synthetase
MQLDLSRLGGMTVPAAPRATVMTFWAVGDERTPRWMPRTTLQIMVNKLQSEYNLNILCGFGIEVIFLKQNKEEHTGQTTQYTPTTTTQSWSQMTADTRRLVPLLEEVRWPPWASPYNNSMPSPLQVNSNSFFHPPHP